MDKVIKLYNYVDGVNDTPFPSIEEQVEIFAFKYNANRMGGAPLVTAKAMHRLCLDNLWNDKVYALFNGERFFVMNTPSSSKSNTDERYEHEIQLLSEREILNHVYFIDAVRRGADTQVSNSPKFQFVGNIKQFVERLNSSLAVSGVVYSAVVDSGITSEDKNISFDKKYIMEALQEAFTAYEIPYYFRGRVIHFGLAEETVGEPLKYGHKNALMSISKSNANYKVINRISGAGSEDNIPYYYPNDSDNRAEIEAAGGKWITPSQNLMPSIYRESKGTERFYNALNGTYPTPEGGYYDFNNPYTEGNPKESFVDFPEIKPTIKGGTNAAGQRIDMFSEFAYDTNDNEEMDEQGNYLHPYFFGKLRKTDGTQGFNLFAQANEKEPMVVSMTSGVCAACKFQIGVGQSTDKNTVQVDESGNLLRDEKGDVRCGREGKPKEVPQDKQNNTQTNEVWVALKKDTETFTAFGMMPNAQRNLRPSTSDTFVLLGITMPKGYILAAEKKLTDSLIKFMFMNNDEKFNFSVKFSRIYFEEHPEVLEYLNENSRILLEYNGSTYPLYVDDFSYKMDGNTPLPEIEVNLTETLTIGKNSLQNALDSVKRDILSSMGGGDFLKQGLKYFLRKDIPDSTNFLLKMRGGAEFGKFNGRGDGAKIDPKGNINTPKIESPEFTSGPFGTGFIMKTDPKTGRSYIETDELYVRLKAYFETLEIKHLSHVGGRIVLSPAGMECVAVEEVSALYENLYDKNGSAILDSIGENIKVSKEGGARAYRCFFKQKDDEKEIVNEFAVDDLAQCREFNVKEGISHQVSNQYYWRRVIYVGEDFIDLSMTDCDDRSGIPKAGDTIVTIGNKTDVRRQNVVFLSSFDDDAPSIKLYSNINSYSMLNKEVTVISPNIDKNIFSGKVIIKPGSTGFENLTDAPDMSEIDKNIQDAKNDAQAAINSANKVSGSVDDLKVYVNGAFSDGIISEAEAAAIETYINIVQSEKATTTATFNELDNNLYLEGSAKISLKNKFTNLSSSIDGLTNTINTAIADGKTNASEKASVDASYSDFIKSLAEFKTAVEYANKSIQDNLKQYSDNALKASDEAKNAASNAITNANEAKDAVSNLNTYIDGAFSDGIISEAEARDIESLFSEISREMHEATVTYDILIRNQYLSVSNKNALLATKNALNECASSLSETINNAIKDGKVSIEEKKNVELKINAFNQKYADLAETTARAHEQIQERIKELTLKETDTKIKNSLGQVSRETRDAIAKQMGYNDYYQMEDAAKRGQTIIQGGYVNTTLIQTDAIVTSALIAKAIMTNTLNVNGNFVVKMDGSVDMNGVMRSKGSANTEAIISNGFLRIEYKGEEKLRLSVNSQTGMPELLLNEGRKSVLIDADGIIFGGENGQELRILASNLGSGEVIKRNDGTLAMSRSTTTVITAGIAASPKEGGTTVPAPSSILMRREGEREWVEAIPNEGYKFVGWSDGGAQNHYVTWTRGKLLVANFAIIEVNKYYIGLSASPSAGGTVTGEGSYKEGTKVRVSATANSGYRFVRWSDGGYQEHDVVCDQNKNLTAYFEEYKVTGDEIFLGTDLNSTEYWQVVGQSKISSVSGGVAKLHLAGDTEGFNGVYFNYLRLGGKLKQGHKYELKISIKSDVEGKGLVGILGKDGNFISNEALIWGESIGVQYKTISRRFTADRDSDILDTFLLNGAGESHNVFINNISLKEI